MRIKPAGLVYIDVDPEEWSVATYLLLLCATTITCTTYSRRHVDRIPRARKTSILATSKRAAFPMIKVVEGDGLWPEG